MRHKSLILGILLWAAAASADGTWGLLAGSTTETYASECALTLITTTPTRIVSITIWPSLIQLDSEALETFVGECERLEALPPEPAEEEEYCYGARAGFVCGTSTTSTGWSDVGATVTITGVGSGEVCFRARTRLTAAPSTMTAYSGSDAEPACVTIP